MNFENRLQHITIKNIILQIFIFGGWSELQHKKSSVNYSRTVNEKFNSLSVIYTTEKGKEGK